MNSVRQPTANVVNTGAGGQDPNRGRGDGNRRPWHGPSRKKRTNRHKCLFCGKNGHHQNECYYWNGLAAIGAANARNASGRRGSRDFRGGRFVRSRGRAEYPTQPPVICLEPVNVRQEVGDTGDSSQLQIQAAGESEPQMERQSNITAAVSAIARLTPAELVSVVLQMYQQRQQERQQQQQQQQQDDEGRPTNQ